MLRQSELDIDKPFSSDMANRRDSKSNKVDGYLNTDGNEYQEKLNPYEPDTYFNGEKKTQKTRNISDQR
jgi:hypothetical protein